MIIAAGFPVYLWLLIVLIIVLVVLWFLFFQGEDGEQGSFAQPASEPTKEDAQEPVATAPETEAIEALEFASSEPLAEMGASDIPEVGVGIVHVTDELEDGEPEDTVDAAEVEPAEDVDEVPDEVADDAEEDEPEDVIVFEGNLSEGSEASLDVANADDMEDAAGVDGIGVVADVMIDETADETEPTEESAAAAAAAVEEDPDAEDRLQIIEGIGPKIETVLKAAGVKTLRKLSGMSVESLRGILGEHQSLRLANPESWPEQARLAAAGDKAALQELQDSLKGGRVVS